NNQKFSKIFLASGTGTTQAGLVCGSYILGTTHEIYGISIARKHNQGFNVVKDSCKDYLNFLGYSYLDGIISNKINFIDSYIFGGYGCKDMNVLSSNLDFFGETGISLDSTYTGKAYYAMKEIIAKNNIKNENILFVHTGGTPLFFEDLKELSK
ncbi:MAG: 1-aminocyclopropane-1-carboxylate deaminase/D-cysteine desulfhydrase, partial [Culicoidibacterales bacterium]